MPSVRAIIALGKDLALLDLFDRVRPCPRQDHMDDKGMGMRSWCQVCGKTKGYFKWACSWDCQTTLDSWRSFARRSVTP